MSGGRGGGHKKTENSAQDNLSTLPEYCPRTATTNQDTTRVTNVCIILLVHRILTTFHTMMNEPPPSSVGTEKDRNRLFPFFA